VVGAVVAGDVGIAEVVDTLFLAVIGGGVSCILLLMT